MHIVKSYNNYKNRKYVFQLDDGMFIETALFEHHKMIHFCVSTQVGCKMGCKHCSTTFTMAPDIRNISCDEFNCIIKLMRDQLWDRSLPRILSFSGHGEPMMNWDNIQKCIYKNKEEFSFIYITSIGVVDVMNRILLEPDHKASIYFSIHGSNDTEREQLITSAKKKDIANLRQIIDFGRCYTKNGGRIVWNYMLCNTNSYKKSFYQLYKLCEGIDYPLEIRFTKYINIHKDNGISEIDDKIAERFFQKFSEITKSNIQIRFSKLKGEDIGIACGQMVASMQEEC